ncbi:MAG: DEAD/DEAH box helicase [Verrucomicrobia bacterium]|nr:DEAD/DEAH box helicase [Verrucomicrobiota bacterium]
MSAKHRSSALRSVRTPEALTALQVWLDALATPAREQGEDYFQRKCVHEVRAKADHYVAAVVEGQLPYNVTLFFTRGRWTSKCSCPTGSDCKHAYAAGQAWLAFVAGGKPDGVDPTKIETTGTEESALKLSPTHFWQPPAAIAPVVSSVSFRERWSPVLAKSLGRTLSEAEGVQLDELAALYNEFAQAHGTLYPGALLRHGFEYTPPEDAALHTPAFLGWWDQVSAPADPWALWQFIAYAYELAGRPIPEVLQPLTRTDGLKALIEDRLVKHELAAWHRVLTTADTATTSSPQHPATVDITGLRARIRSDGGVNIETRTSPSNTWKAVTHRWLTQLATARPVHFEHLSAPEAALGAALAAESRIADTAFGSKKQLSADTVEYLLRTRAVRDAFVLPDGSAFAIQPSPLLLDAVVSPTDASHLDLRLATPDGRDASAAAAITFRPTPLYLFENSVWHGPPPTPSTPLPKAALEDSRMLTRLRAVGLRLPSALEANVQRITLRPLLKCWLVPAPDDENAMVFNASLHARADDFPYEQHWSSTGWQWTAQGAPPPRRPTDPLLELNLSGAQPATTRLADFGLGWSQWENHWTRAVAKTFPDEFIAWHATLPPGLHVEVSPGLSSLLGPPLRAHVEVSAAPATSGGRDWFNLTVNLRVADTTLTPDEIALLLKARGKWVSLPRHGWQRLEVEPSVDGNVDAALHRLGLGVEDVLAGGRPTVHRIHALQLAAEADLLEQRDAQLARALRERIQTLATQAPPPLPEGLRATLRPYQEEGYRFLAHLSALGLGGILADDMGLGKTVQALAWMLHLAASPRAEPNLPTDAKAAPTPALPFRALVVCPKSVVHGWLAESARFAPSLKAVVLDPLLLGSQLATPEPRLLVTNYAQLRINAVWFRAQNWDAVVLDEGQFIKNPGSQVAATARSLNSRHRVVLTGTPIENRLTDLWSLFAFAQPGLLGTQTAFRRHYNEDDPEALARLHCRVRHFLLRRTKAQAAPDLPPRTEDEITVTLEGAQRRLYDAELKRARAQLLGVDTNQALAAVRFNVLSSLLRLRQICCHPALVDPAHRDLPSAKLEALMEQLEELRDEGHQVLVFSQFVEMLNIIRDRLVAADIGYLMLTGATENRGELVEEFQRDRSKTVFLLSLKAAGSGLNLTAASYVILYDPWWNPAVEAQAIDRTHRIGQTQPVVAYRLLAESTVEEKIRVMQREKASLSLAVVQEESLATVLDLDGLRSILS